MKTHHMFFQIATFGNLFFTHSSLQHHMNKATSGLLCAVFVIILSLSLQGQQLSSISNQAKPGDFPETGLKLTLKDSLIHASLPVLILPKSQLKSALPDSVDNSKLLFFRPIINQVGQECSQVSAVAYTFTYEINRLRNLAPDIPENQYPTHFTSNWGNFGSGAAVSYFDSWDVIRRVGTPNVAEYGGGLNTGGETRWMTGYEKYYHAMHNRLWEFCSIPVDTEEGLLTLKHWIDNHLNSSGHGGLANLYCSYNYPGQSLPANTPEAGKMVLIELLPDANHSVCLVGYHDSIRYDYNNDGQFTNHIDINNDGQVNILDWEMGGVKIANTHGDTWGNDGFSYIMYSAFCRKMSQSGIWNGAVHVIRAKEQTIPQLTFRINLTHDSRNKLKVMAGVASSPNAPEPEFVMDFPILNYQGGNLYMQGGGAPEDKTIEIGLDVSELLNHINSASEASFFLSVDENDPGNSGTGMIDNWSLIDYTNGLIEINYPQTNVPLIENQTTILALNASVGFEQPEIINDTLPLAIVNLPYENQMDVAGATGPYYWYLLQDYSHQYDTADFPVIDEQPLFPTDSSNGYAEVGLQFNFPFYGASHSWVYVHTDGYLMFEPAEYPWIFSTDEINLFRNMLNISPCASKVLGITGGGGMWYEGDETKATIRWKGVVNGSSDVSDFAVSLYPSGEIEFYYGSIDFPPWIKWYAGISEGNAFNYKLLEISNDHFLPENTHVKLTPDFAFNEIQLSREGLFHGLPTMPYDGLDVTFYIKDANGISNMKTLPFSTDTVLMVYAGDDVTVCENQSHALQAQANNAVSVSWFSDGDGVFSDPLITGPVYTPGASDIENGEVTLTIVVSGSSGNQVSDALLFTVQYLPQISAGNDITICDGEAAELNAFTANTNSVLWFSDGDGTFEDSTQVVTFYYPGVEDVITGTAELYLTCLSISPCQSVLHDSITISINPMPEVSFDEIPDQCLQWSPLEMSGGNPEGGSYSGPGVLEGWFYADMAGSGTHTLIYQFSDINGCANSAEQTVIVSDCSGIDDPKSGVLKLSPNPGNGIFMIGLEAAMESDYLLEVFNSRGSLILSEVMDFKGSPSYKIDLTAQQEGIYFVFCSGQKMSHYNKIIIVK